MLWCLINLYEFILQLFNYTFYLYESNLYFSLNFIFKNVSCSLVFQQIELTSLLSYAI